jgi:hypothetical protein
MNFDFLSTQYPSNDVADGSKLYRSLGSFWTSVFQEKTTLKGYTNGMAEELIQSYYKLIETLNTYSVKDVPVLSTKRWQPLEIRRSKFDTVPFVFQENSAVFGMQPEYDRFYAGKTFRFGFPKDNNDNVFSYQPSFNLAKFSVIADRIIDPTMVLLNGVDVIIDEFGTLYFNSNVFENSSLPRQFAVDDNGEPITYRNAAGEIVDEELIILWVYHAENDDNILQDSFGKILDFQLKSSEGYKAILRSVMNLFVEGPTVNGIKTTVAALLGITPVLSLKERVEDVYQDSLFHYVITDKNVYKFNVDQRLLPSVTIGAEVHAGDILVDLAQYHDSVISPRWWNTSIESSKLGLASHLFIGNYRHQLFFTNSPELATLSADGKITFPVDGTAHDVQEFHNWINHEDNISEAKIALNLIHPGNTSVINPVNFLFENFLKANTALLKFNFSSPDEMSRFFSYFPVIREYLPPHVYLLFYINLNIPGEVYGSLNSRYGLKNFPQVSLSLDGSLENGLRPRLSEEDPEYYKDYENRLFCLSASPIAENGEQLFDNSNLEQVTLFSSGNSSSGQPRVVDGKIFTHIPSNRIVTTRNIPTVLIIDFS